MEVKMFHQASPTTPTARHFRVLGPHRPSLVIPMAATRIALTLLLGAGRFYSSSQLIYK